MTKNVILSTSVNNSSACTPTKAVETADLPKNLFKLTKVQLCAELVKSQLARKQAERFIRNHRLREEEEEKQLLKIELKEFKETINLLKDIIKDKEYLITLYEEVKERNTTKIKELKELVNTII